MMGETVGTQRIVGATLLSLALIIGAYALARGVGAPRVAQASTETALLQAIATKDSTGDGLPDWEKVLYGIPINATTTDYFHLGMTDGQAVAQGLIVPKAIADIPTATTTSETQAQIDADDGLPAPPADDTITASFAKSFFNLYLAAKEANGGADLSETDTQNIANEALMQLAQSVAATPDFKSMQNLTTTPTGTDALKTFAAQAQAVFLTNTSNATTSELTYLQYALQNTTDTTALSHIASIAKAYRDSAIGLAALPVPQVLATDDLALINALARMSDILTDFTSVNTDPLAAILALNQYAQTVVGLSTALSNVDAAYTTAGIVLPPGTPGASFVNIMTNITVSQKNTAQKP
jgi:hypothetical protein